MRKAALQTYIFKASEHSSRGWHLGNTLFHQIPIFQLDNFDKLISRRTLSCSLFQANFHDILQWHTIIIILFIFEWLKVTYDFTQVSPSLEFFPSSLPFFWFSEAISHGIHANNVYESLIFWGLCRIGFVLASRISHTWSFNSHNDSIYNVANLTNKSLPPQHLVFWH